MPTEVAAAPATLDDGALMRLLQLASPGLPIGAYAYSQGLEWAVEAAWVHDATSLAAWTVEVLHASIARVDVPLLARLYAAALAHDTAALTAWSDWLVASRETRELRHDDCARGQALARLVRELDLPGPALHSPGEAPLALLFAQLAAAWRIPLRATLHAYVWGWLENQILCGVKLIPLGQAAGQRLMLRVADQVPAVIRTGLALADDEIGGTLPALAIASSRHETQYTRLFRS